MNLFEIRQLVLKMKYMDGLTDKPINVLILFASRKERIEMLTWYVSIAN
jgi:hypothetical protein